jgi:hypothetical protein
VGKLTFAALDRMTRHFDVSETAMVRIVCRARRNRLPGMTADFSNCDAGFTAYENGKHRRYELLFAVNGGVFALAKLIPDITKAASNPATPFLGHLSVDHVALGMIAFTAIMFVDIEAFGLQMRGWHYRIYPKERGWGLLKNTFSLIGFFVLFLLCTLLCGGWYLVQDKFPRDLFALWALSAFVLSTLWYWLSEARLTTYLARPPPPQVDEI